MRAHRTRAIAVAALLAPVLSVLSVGPLGQPSAAAPPTCDGEPATIVGTTGADVLEGTAKDDVIVALAGNDVVHGKGGDDLICGGNGSDRLFGESGNDRLFGGFDRRAEDSSGAYLLGDVLDGGSGDDLLVGVYDKSVGSHRLPDTFSFSEAPAGVVVDLSEQPGVAVGQGTDTLRFGDHVGVEGSLHADTITGSPGRDTINGLAGDDTIRGGDGADMLYAEKVGAEGGDDLVQGGRGADLLGSYVGRDDLRGGPGDDFVEAYSDKPTRVSGDPGDDYVAQNLTAGSGASSEGGVGRDVITLYGALVAGGDPRTQLTIDLRTGTTSASLDPPATGSIGAFEEYRLIGNLRWRFHGSPLRDRVHAVSGGPLRAGLGAGDDWAHGTERDDRVNGGDGTDTVIGGGGRDTCRGVERGC